MKSYLWWFAITFVGWFIGQILYFLGNPHSRDSQWLDLHSVKNAINNSIMSSVWDKCMIQGYLQGEAYSLTLFLLKTLLDLNILQLYFFIFNCGL